MSEPVEIVVDAAEAQRVAVDLSGIPVVLRLRWWARARRWTLGISRADGSAVIDNLSVTPGAVYSMPTDGALPVGEIAVEGPAQGDRREDLGAGMVLVWRPA